MGKAYKLGAGALTAGCIQLGMQKVLATKSFLTSNELGDPAAWLPSKLRRELQDAQVQKLKKEISNPLALSRAKDHAGISDSRARTLLLDMLPDSSWVPSATSLQQARTDTNRQMQVSPTFSSTRSRSSNFGGNKTHVFLSYNPLGYLCAGNGRLHFHCHVYLLERKFDTCV